MKIDLKKELKPLYTASAQQATLVTGWPLQYLMFNGYGDPDTNPDFQAGVEALYTASYTLKFRLKKELDLDWVVPPLEGLWWMLLADFDPSRRDDWRWTLMLATAGRGHPGIVGLRRWPQPKRKSRCRPWRSCAWKFMTRAGPPRFSTSAPTARRRPPSTACTPSFKSKASISAASTTRSI